MSNDREWRAIPGWEGLYDVSNDGHVRRAKSKRELQPWRSKKGYLSVGLWRRRARKWLGVHRLVALAFCSNPDAKPEVNHWDFDTTNNHWSNLIWATTLENAHHSALSGRPHRTRRFSPQQALEIRNSASDAKALAQQFDVTPDTIRRIKAGKTYRYVDSNSPRFLQADDSSAGSTRLPAAPQGVSSPQCDLADGSLRSPLTEAPTEPSADFSGSTNTNGGFGARTS